MQTASKGSCYETDNNSTASELCKCAVTEAKNNVVLMKVSAELTPDGVG